MSSFFLLAAVISLLVTNVGYSQDARLGASCDLSILGASETRSFLGFDQELRSALSKQDSAAIALLVQFPLRINDSNGSYSLNDPAELQSRLQEVFPTAIRTVVLNQQPATLFCNYSGIMYGKGDVWITRTNHGYAIQVVNLPQVRGNEERRTGPKLEFACQTEKSRIVIDVDVTGARRYRAWTKPHPPTGEPDLEISKGSKGFEGMGVCAYPFWTFSTNTTTYTIRGIGCYSDSDQPPKGARGMLEVSVADKPRARSWCY